MALIMTITSKERETEIKPLLIAQGHTVVARPVTLAVLGFARLDYPQVILFELGSGKDLNLISSLRSLVSSPILVILPKLEEDKRATLAVEIFSLGVDSCCSADSHADEVVARLEALMRRALAYRSFPPSPKGAPQATPFENGSHALPEKVISMTPLEKKIISILSSNKNTIVPGDYICEQLWGEADEVKRKKVRQLIYMIRKKLDLIYKKGYIVNYKRKGYLLRKNI